MITLFAPSESKRPGGDLPPVDATAFCCPERYPACDTRSRRRTAAAQGSQTSTANAPDIAQESSQLMERKNQRKFSTNQSIPVLAHSITGSTQASG